MKKLSLQLLTAFDTGTIERVKAVKIFLLTFLFCCASYHGFTQVVVTPATGGSAICSPVCTTLNPITIKETHPADFSGLVMLTLKTPAGWTFCDTPNLTYDIGGDIATVPPPSRTLITDSTLNIMFTVTGGVNLDSIKIVGLAVMPAPGAAPGDIYATSVAGVPPGSVVLGVSGTTPGETNFGSLDLINVAGITGNSSVCFGATDTLTDTTPGGAWSSSGGAATISPTGVITTHSVGSSTIFYTVSGCSVSFVIAVNPLPDPIVGITPLCAYSSTITVRDSTAGGVWSSTIVNIANVGTTGIVTSNAQGTGTITYTLPSGCYVTAKVTINPLPSLITGDSLVCVGSTLPLLDSVGPGTWTSLHTGIATVGSTAGSGPYYYGTVLGVTAGIDTIVYTLATGCSRFYVVTVNPLPAGITSPSGLFSMCDLGTDSLADATPGGTWSISSAPPPVAVISATGVVTGISPGTATVIYTLPTSCAVINSVTVNPNPPAIGGPTQVCVGGAINLTDALGPGKWTSGNTAIATIDSNTGLLTGVDSGVVTIFYTLGTGCQTQELITVNPLPTAIYGPTAVCVGSTIQDSVATPGGVWSASNPTAIVTAGGYITGVPPGPSIDTIYYTLPTGCLTSTVVTIDAVPEPILGVDSMCQGATIHLTDGSTGGTWVSGDPSRAVFDSAGYLRGVIADTLPVYIYYQVGICFSPAFPVTVDPVPPPYSGDTTVCAGSTTTLTDSLPGGTWSASLAFATIGSLSGVVTGISSGSLDITYTDRGACFSYYRFTVYPSSPITGPGNVCVSDSISLLDSIPGGVWTESNGHVSIADIGIGASIAQLQVIGVSSGVDTIYYTTFNGCPNYFIVTVNPLSPITISPGSSVCVGSTATVSDSTIGGVWSSSDTSIATVDSAGVVTGVSAGTPAISYLLPATGCLAVLQITVDPLPYPIYGDSTICQGYTDTLNDTTTFSAGIWSSSNDTIASFLSPTSGQLTGNMGGAVTVTFTLGGTGCAVYYNVTVNPLASIYGADSVCEFAPPITVTDSVPGGVWSTTPTALGSIDSSGNFTGLLPGVDTVIYTLPSGCSAVFLVTVDEVPSPIGGLNYVCKGNLLTLSDTAANGIWSSSTVTVATVVTLDSFHGSVFGTGPGVDTITYFLPTGACSISTEITVDPVPLSPVGLNHVCVGDTITITDPTQGGFWTNLDTPYGIIDTTGVGGDSVVVVIGRAQGVDVILYTLPTPAQCNTSAIITVEPIPVIVISDTLPELKCPYASVNLHASGAYDSSTGFPGTYLWEMNYALSSDTGANIVATPTLTTTYTVVGTTTWGCPDSAFVTVFVDDSMTHLRVVALDSICKGQCDVLNASGRAGSAFNWHPPVGLNCTICDTPTACPDTTTEYWAVAIDDIGCKDSISFTVTVNPIPVVMAYPDPLRLCRGIPAQITATSTNTDSLTDKYGWYPDILISNDSVRNPFFTDTTNLVYKVTATTIYGCYDSTFVKVSVLDTNLNLIRDDTSICIYDSTYLWAYSHSLISNLDVPTYTWAPTEYVNNPDSNYTIIRPFVTTVYTVTIVENACFTKYLTVTVSVQPYPEIGLTPSFESVVAGTPVQLIAFVNNTPVQTYLWSPTTSCDTCFNPVAIPTAGSTTYTVVVTSIYGCVTTDTVTINTLCDNSEVFIPNTFTPNGDGVNDRFFVSGKGITIINYLKVFNRWGQLVFEADNIPPNESAYGWDGTFKGLVLEPDVFVYFVEAQCELGTQYKYQGNVSLIH